MLFFSLKFGTSGLLLSFTGFLTYGQTPSIRSNFRTVKSSYGLIFVRSNSRYIKFSSDQILPGKIFTSSISPAQILTHSNSRPLGKHRTSSSNSRSFICGHNVSPYFKLNNSKQLRNAKSSRNEKFLKFDDDLFPPLNDEKRHKIYIRYFMVTPLRISIQDRQNRQTILRMIFTRAISLTKFRGNTKVFRAVYFMLFISCRSFVKSGEK